MTKNVAILMLSLLIAAESPAQSALDGFDPGANNTVYAMAVQADGKIIVVGDFTTLGGGGSGMTARSRIGRLNPDGTLDPSFNPGANGTVYAVAVQADGKILVGGQFTTIGSSGFGTPRLRLGRLNADGTLDTSFDARVTTNFGTVYSLAVQADGKILVGGDFGELGDPNTTQSRKFIGRFTAEGFLDLSFDPGADSPVRGLVEQRDGKVLVAGAFTTLGGGGTGTTSRQRLGRLHPSGTLDPSFDPGANSTVRALAVQPDGKILVGGTFATLGGGGSGMTARSRIGRLNADGTVDSGFDPGADSNVFAVTLQTDGNILVAGNFTNLGGGGSGTTPRSRIGRLRADGTLDSSFNPGANSGINALGVQADGKILLGGNFTGMGGGAGITPRNRIARLYPTGTVDATFDPGANGSVFTLAVQADGKIVIGGFFNTMLGGGTATSARNFIARLDLDGALDTGFDPGANNSVHALAVQADGKVVVGGDFTTFGFGGTGLFQRNRLARVILSGFLDDFNPGANGHVNALAVQADGKILVGGFFTMLGGGGSGTTPRSRIGRLHPDGSLDTSFDPGANGYVFTLAVQPDGKILVGGQFSTLGGGGTGTTTCNRLGRLNTDGTLDTSFDGNATLGDVHCLALQTDGKILVGGSFLNLGGHGTIRARSKIGRLHADGALDFTFNPGADGRVDALALQADGKILVGGYFTTLGGGGSGTTARNRIGRLHPDGTLDPSFDPGASDVVDALALQLDGKIVVGGNFNTLGGGGAGTTARSKIGRLTNTDAALQALTFASDGTTVTWLRSGAAPELDRVAFHFSTDAVAHPTRIAGGWQLTGQSLPLEENIFVRARGFYSKGTGSILETVRSDFLFVSLTPTQVVSRKLHNGAAFDINLPLTGNSGVECRSGGASNNYQVVLTFPSVVTFTSAALSAGTGSVSGSSGSGTTTVTVNLTGVIDAQRITVTLFGVNNGVTTGNVSVPMGVLLGDANGDGSVNSADTAITRNRSGQPPDATNFRSDYNVDGFINAADATIVRARSGQFIP